MRELFLRNKTDIFPVQEIIESHEDFTWNYLFSGRYPKKGNKKYIELAVATWLIDSQENLFMRCCIYNGQKYEWKEAIVAQIHQMMRDLHIENQIIKSETRYFEVSNDHFVKPEVYHIELEKIRPRGN